MIAEPLACPKCRAPLPEALHNLGHLAPCPACRTAVQCAVFPALHAAPRIGRPGEPLVEASEASCFFHPEKRAAVACEGCGRFLCALCELDLDGRHICPSCLTAGRKKGALGNLDRFRVSYGGIALLVAVLPAIGAWPLTPITAPIALVVACIGLRKPRSLTGRRRVLTYALAFLIAGGEIVAWCVWGGKLWRSLTHG